MYTYIHLYIYTYICTHIYSAVASRLLGLNCFPSFSGQGRIQGRVQGRRSLRCERRGIRCERSQGHVQGRRSPRCERWRLRCERRRIRCERISHEQALVCLSNREIVDASRGCTFYCKMANNRFFSNCFGLVYLAIYPPSIIKANVRPPSASTDFFNFSETRACSWPQPLGQPVRPLYKDE